MSITSNESAIINSIATETLVSDALVEHELHAAYTTTWLLRLSKRAWIIEAVTRLQRLV